MNKKTKELLLTILGIIGIVLGLIGIGLLLYKVIIGL